MSDKPETKIIPLSFLEPRVIKARVGIALKHIGTEECRVISDAFLAGDHTPGDNAGSTNPAAVEQALRALRGMTFH